MRPTSAAAVLLAAALAGGCNKTRMPYFGHWLGGFETTSSTSLMSTSAIEFRGYLQLYRVDNKFLIQLSNQSQVLNLGGVWKVLRTNRIELTFNSFRLDEPDLDKLKAMRRPYLEPEDLRAAYGKPMILDLKPDGSLEGLLVHVGPLIGKHAFKKGE
jgi:hypothetical protein